MEMEESQLLQIKTFEQIPSPSDFASRIESRNVPAVFVGCVKDWKAFTKWNPENGGLEYLQERVGSAIVEAMLSKSAPVFYGDLRSHERVPVPFSTFLGYCKQRIQEKDDTAGVSSESETRSHTAAGSDQETWLSADASLQIYLAQVPIMNAEDRERVRLTPLWEDIQTPSFLGNKELASVNLWMNNAQARSSTHYDPHHNLLCVVAGSKQVVLWPPSASPLLYPMPLFGEASNHSSVPLENPDFSIHPRAQHCLESSLKVMLCAGDALFIPEGWFHQVDSNDLTVAVNFWWQSNIMSSMSEHMDAYYLRRILRRLIDKEMNQVVPKASSSGMEVKIHTCENLDNREADHRGYNLDQIPERQEVKEKEHEQTVELHQLEPAALQVLNQLVSSVHDRVNVTAETQTRQPTTTMGSVAIMNDEGDRISNLFSLDEDPIAKMLFALDPYTFQNVLLVMSHNFPRTLEALILHLLSPVGAEVLTRKFDEMDEQNSEEDRSKFYQAFYSSFDDQFAAMDAILKGKELFSRQAFENVLEKYLGVKFNVS